MRLQVIALISLIIISFVGYLLLGNMAKSPTLLQNLNDNASSLGGNFSLTNSHGQPFDSQQLNGKPSILYFGFTYCPDVCVVSLQKVNKLIEHLDKYNISVNPVFITIDPNRDTVAALNAYFAYYNPNFIALTGTESQIKHVTDLYKVYYSVRGDQTTNDYMLDHSTFIYLLDKNQKYITHFTMSSTIEEMVEYIRVYAR